MSSWLFAAATASRLLLSVLFPDLPDLLTARVEVSTPITSFKRCKTSFLSFHSSPMAHPPLTCNTSAGRCFPLQEWLFSIRRRGIPPSQYSSPFTLPSSSSLILEIQAPALLPILGFLPDYRSYPLLMILLYTAFDLLSANALLLIARHGESTSSRYFESRRKDLRWSPFAVAAA